MSWLQLTLACTSEQVATYETALEDAHACSVTLSDAADQPLLEPGVGETPLWNHIVITALFDEAINKTDIQQILASHLTSPLPNLKWETIDDRDWVGEWMENFQPIQFGERLWICPQWQQPPDENAVNLILDPGLAFGTGTHPTTALCLKWLDTHNLREKTVLDYGCGSGILGIAAVLLGAKSVTAIDIDPQALAATTMNAEKNGCSDRIQTGFPSSMPDKFTADIVIANILTVALVDLAAELVSYLRPGGILILSGILKDQTRIIENTYQPHVQLTETAFEGDWCRIQAKKTLPD